MNINNIIKDIEYAVTHRGKVFLLSGAIVFLMVILSHAGLHFSMNSIFKSSSIISPLPQTAIPVIEQLMPKLQKKLNRFQLIQTRNIIPAAHASETYDNAHAYALVDYDTGEVIAEKNLSQRYAIASITKLLSATVALDLVAPEQIFTISDHAAHVTPTVIGMVVGEQMTLEELLQAALMTSANDAVEVIKEGVDDQYGPGTFVAAMNKKAQILGLRDSSFENPQGFDGQQHLSSAEDVAVLSHYAIENYPLIADIVKKDLTVLPANQNHKKFDLINWNGLLGIYPGVYGGKIGNTDDAGKTTVVTAVRSSDKESKKLIAVVLGAPDIITRDLWASQLLDLGFEKTLGLKPVGLTEELLREKKYTPWNTLMASPQYMVGDRISMK